jgi:large conductance mechanosensitive channel protein
MFKEFREFIKRGNVMDLAVAVILAAAFGAIIKTLVEGIIMPPIGLLLGKVDFASMFYNLTDKPVTSLADAKAKGVPVIAYGQFIKDSAQGDALRRMLRGFGGGVNSFHHKGTKAQIKCLISP